MEDVRVAMEQRTSILTAAAERKQEDSETVLQALLDLEQLSRQAAKLDSSSSSNNNDNDNKEYAYAKEMLQHLDGSWRLIFTTGTVNTQKKYGNINYFPLKAVQSFDTETGRIANGIYFGETNFCLLQFTGTFTFDERKRKLEFDFDTLLLLQTFSIALQRGQAASLGAKSGLGSESNVVNAQRRQPAFFNWISANAHIATARGGGGGLALWKRVVVDDGEKKEASEEEKK